MAKGVWTEVPGQAGAVGKALLLCVGSLGTRVLAFWLGESNLPFLSGVFSLLGTRAGGESDLWDFFG